MISCYKNYHIIYWTIGIIAVTAMVILDFCNFALWPLWTLICICLVLIDAYIFTKLGAKRLSEEVVVLYNDCRIHEYLEAVEKLLGKRKGPLKSMYSYMMAAGYSLIDEYDMVFECCQNITYKPHKMEYRTRMIDYYINKEQFDLAEKEIEEQKTAVKRVKNKIYKNKIELSLKSAEYSIRIKRGEYEGAEEFYLGILASPQAKYNITKTSYSYALGKLLVLKGEPGGARQYLEASHETAGDSKYKKLSEKLLESIK